MELIISKPAKKSIKKRRKSAVKVQVKEEPKKAELEAKIRPIDKESYYKKYFSGRCSFNSRQTDRLFDIIEKTKAEKKAYGCQVDIA